MMTIFISSIILSGVLFVYQYNFVTVNKAVNDSEQRNTLLSLETEINQLLINYEATVEIINAGDGIVIDGTEISFLEADNSIQITRADGRLYGLYDVTRLDGLPIFTSVEENRAIELNIIAKTKNESLSYTKIFLLRKGAYDEEYL